MKRAQIKELADSIANHGALPEKDLSWIFKNFSKQELKLFLKLLQTSLKEKNVIVYYAGELSEENKKKLTASFTNKNIEFKRDDNNITAGITLEFGDYIWDYSISGIIKRTLKSIRESL